MNEKKSLFKDNYVNNLIFLTIILFLVEVLFRAISGFAIVDFATARIFISCFIISILVTLVSCIIPNKCAKNIINLIFIFAYSIYSWLQLGFLNYLGVYISLNTSSQLGAVADYIKDFLLSFRLIYFVVFIPFVTAILFYFVLGRKKRFINLKFKNLLFVIPTLLVSCLIYYISLTASFMQNEFQIKSNTSLFRNPDVPTVAVNQFGTVMFGLLDLKTFIFPVDEDSSIINKVEQSENIDVTREVLPVLNNLAESETNKTYKSLNNYFVSRPITDYNEYTGMFEGKNVVVILLESVNEAIINEEYFPNFYNLYSNGWHWDNTYSPRNSCATGNNEFSAMTSLYSIYNTCTTNTYKNNKYNQAIFNLFNDKGYNTTSMHNFKEWYYYRSTIHPNMGSGKYYGSSDLDIKTANYYGEWPSDVEFFEKAFNIILNDESDKPFMTWLTTVTSHQPYTSSSTYGDLYKDEFKAKGYSTAVSRYLSKLKVVDEAIGKMVEMLKEKNELDNTVIVMLADHYPYGLNKAAISEMIDHDLSDYDIEKTPFVIYNSSMEPKSFDEYNSYINVVPTIANLMNLPHDPRLMMGTDLLSEDYESRVVFADGSWKNEIAFYNASTSKVTYYTEKIYTSEEIQSINTDVSLQISMSSKAIKNNYFNYLGKEIDKYNKEQEQLRLEELEAALNEEIIGEESSLEEVVTEEQN